MSDSHLSLSPRFDNGEVISALWRYDSNDEKRIAERVQGRWKMFCFYMCTYKWVHLGYFSVNKHVEKHRRTRRLMWDMIQSLSLSSSLNGLLMESNEGILPRQMCPLCNTVLPWHRKIDPSETSASKQPLPALIKLCMRCTNFNSLFFFSTKFASCCCTPGNRSKYHYDIAPRVTLNDKSAGSVSQAQNLLPGHLLHWGVKLF